jgi:hypothetical protein
MKLSTVLQKQAEQIRAQSSELVAVGILKKAGLSDTEARLEVSQRLMEKEAASQLTDAGIDYDVALEMIKLAGVKVSTLKEFKVEKSSEELLAETFEKAASLALELEGQVEERDVLLEKIASLQDELDSVVVTERVPDSITKFAESGAFTNEDLQAMMKLPTDTLTKIASSQEKPWSMGKSAGQSTESLDPIAQFCLS